MAPVAVDGADGVNHVRGGQAITLGDLGVTRAATVQGPALGEELGTSGTVDRAVDTAASEQ
ncbi:hypothetical protein SDC9_162992 [bioreactor metagenome]|uniref:Uncharacterized protein n=1 Tax=bioreactor metagenome TaxID=1076179 RepID=A0A645FML5_9ZZZZ